MAPPPPPHPPPPPPIDKLPDSLLLQIMSRLRNSADVARCRLVSKAFNALFPELRSISLRCSIKWQIILNSKNSHSDSDSESDSSNYQYIKPFKSVFLDLLSKQKIVESLCIGFENPASDMNGQIEIDNDDYYITDGDFAKEWLPRVSDSLKSLTISGLQCLHRHRPSTILSEITAYCHNLVNLNITIAYVSLDNLNPMPLVTTLTFSTILLKDEDLRELNNCFPNLQVLNLKNLIGVKNPRIHLHNLKTFHWTSLDDVLKSLTIITPNLTTLKVEIDNTEPPSLHVEAPMLSDFHLGHELARTVTIKKFENLKTLFLDSLYIGYILSEFPVTKTVESLSLHASDALRDTGDLKLTLRKVFTVFPNVSSLCVYSDVWLELEACSNPEVWEILDGRKGLKTLSVYSELVDPSLTFASIALVLDQCVGLSDVSLFFHDNVVSTLSESFKCVCKTRWPKLKWDWGSWSTELEYVYVVNSVFD